MTPFTNDMTFILGGDAGQGMESSGAGFARALVRDGLHVFAGPDYHSRIRGGHNFYTVRVSPHQVSCHRRKAHLLLALTKDSVDLHLNDLNSGGGVIFDPGTGVNASEIATRGLRPVPVPAAAMAKEAGDVKMANSALLGAAAALVGWDLGAIGQVMTENFGRKNAALAEANIRVAQAGADAALRENGGAFPWRIEPVKGQRRLLLGGSQAVCLGAVAAGCRFVAGYPMTPTTPILEWWGAHGPRLGLVLKHAEDEIAAVNMAIGANYVGVRAMTATAGGGFSLMVEALGLAGMLEVPVVIIEGQRSGPSTSMATRTEQGDLLSVLHAGQGEFLRIVMTPGTVSECFECTWRAFNLAEKYQTPVIVIIDQYLAHFLRSLNADSIDLDGVRIDRGTLLDDADLAALMSPYERYQVTPDGVSPRALPGHPKAVYAVTTDEHLPDGHISEDAANRIRMQKKRLAKTEAALKEMRPPTAYGPADAPLALVCWGSSYGVVREAVDELNAAKMPARLVHFADVWPFPAVAAAAALQGAKRIVSVEGNASGQFAWLLSAETCIKSDALISRFDGRPFVVEDILDAL